MVVSLLALLLLLPRLPQESGAADPRSTVRLAERPEAVRVLSGPSLLHAAIEQQWGGHTFSYLLQGERGVFWSALAGPAGPVLIGQAPLPGSELEARVTVLSFDALAPARLDQPQMLRTPDGTLHVFVGVERSTDHHGDVRYLVSTSPEDVTRFEDRSERIPRTAYPTFHQNRKNVGLDRRGERAVLFVLSDYVESRYLMNTPLFFAGRVEATENGTEIRFEEPRVFGPPTQFFYPQVAATDEGPVLVGAVHDEPSRHAELVHLDWEGNVLFHERLPFPEGQANTWAYELEPFDPDDWSRLLLVRSIVPAEGTLRTIEFWAYDTRARTLSLLRSIPNDFAHALSITNAGQVWTRPGRPPLFLNEPASQAVRVWEGELEGPGPMRLVPLPGTRVAELGLPSIRSVFLPSVLQGSRIDSGPLALALDADLACTPAGESSPCAWLLWWLERTD